jgi:hypothetical protein
LTERLRQRQHQGRHEDEQQQMQQVARTRKIPNQIGDNPICWMIGSRMGVVSSINARPSSTEPSNNNKAAINNNDTARLSLTDASRLDTCEAMPVRLMNTENISAPMMTV